MAEVDLEALFGQYGTVDELELSEELGRHLQERGITEKHIVSFTEIVEVFSGQPSFFLNAGGALRRAPIVMVGPTQSGRILCVPIEPTSKRGEWSPVTAFTANTHHVQRYEREARN